MARRVAAAEEARDAVLKGSWAEAYELYRALEPSRLSADDFDALADAAWWMCRIDESIARQKAYRGHLRHQRPRQAATAA